ncbi:hypothetical protein OAJ60_05685 [Planctomycetaceae bacterium]|nr:hypothetical protein [Planctomycetaceae bacterium]
MSERRLNWPVFKRSAKLGRRLARPIFPFGARSFPFLSTVGLRLGRGDGVSSRRGLSAAVEGRLEGELSRFAEFRDRILEKMSWRVLELSAEFRLVSRAVIFEGLYNLLSERFDEPRGLVDGVVLVGRTGR